MGASRSTTWAEGVERRDVAEGVKIASMIFQPGARGWITQATWHPLVLFARVHIYTFESRCRGQSCAGEPSASQAAPSK